MKKTLLLLLLPLFLPHRARAFPEMVRHGYNNCILCHASTNGGGLINAYGRALSKAVLSHGKFFFENAAENAASDRAAPGAEEKFLFGAARTPDWLELGGDLRFLQTYSDTRDATDARFIAMQMDLEGRAIYKRLLLQATVGRKELPQTDARLSDALLSRRHWLALLAGPPDAPDKAQARVGRFYPAFGIQVPDHYVVTRRGLGFDENQETYNAEAAYMGKTFEGHLTGIFGRPDDSATDARSRKGVAIDASAMLNSSHKIGFSAMSARPDGRSSGSRANTLGLHDIWGFSENVFLLFESDATRADRGKWGLLEYSKLGWEVEQGLVAHVNHQFSRGFPRGDLSIFESYGVGLQYFPRPHWEFQLVYEKQRDRVAALSFADVAWLLLHFYL